MKPRITTDMTQVRTGRILLACLCLLAFFAGGFLTERERDKIPWVASARAAEPSPENLPEITKDGEKWGSDVVEHSIEVTQGREVKKPPFVDSDAAASLALAASVMEKATKMDLTSLSRDPDFIALLDLMQTRLQAGETPTFEESHALYEALNAQQQTFGPLGRILNFVMTLGPFFKAASQEERHTEGQRVLLPLLHPEQQVTVDFVNGVQTPFINGLAAAAYLGQQLEIDVNHIHNEAGPLPGDLLQALLNKLDLSKDLAVQQVTDQVRQHAQADKPYLLICHSQGAAICAQGITKALNEAPPEEQAKIKERIGVLTLGGFTTDADFPSEITRRSICATADPVCPLAKAIDFTKPVKAIKGQIEALADASTGFHHSLTDIYLPPEDARVPGDMRDAVIEAKDEILAQISCEAILQFNSPTYSVNENAGIATVTVTRTGDASCTVGVNYVTSDGTATAGLDYVTTSGTLIFGPGETSKTFAIPISTDAMSEGEETINLTLSNPTRGASLSSQRTAVLTIKEPVDLSGTWYVSSRDCLCPATMVVNYGLSCGGTYTISYDICHAGLDPNLCINFERRFTVTQSAGGQLSGISPNHPCQTITGSVTGNQVHFEAPLPILHGECNGEMFCYGFCYTPHSSSTFDGTIVSPTFISGTFTGAFTEDLMSFDECSMTKVTGQITGTDSGPFTVFIVR